MIDRILRREEFKLNPPILVDVGASGGIHPRWKTIARYSICIAFDADDREMSVTERDSSGFQRLIVINRIVTDRAEEEIDFYLTKSPFCSSTLEPDLQSLSRWPTRELFQVEKKTRLKAVRLMEALDKAGITRVDWIKIDTQGTDLRIFNSLPVAVRNRVLAAEFEPGILDAYRGEDKLHAVMAYMSTSFFMSSLEVKGVARMDPGVVGRLPGLRQRALRVAHRFSPGWAEVCYMNTLETNDVDSRSYLLGYAFALIEKQYGFALEVAEKALLKNGEPFFHELREHALGRISAIQFKSPFFGIRNRLDRAFQAVFG